MSRTVRKRKHRKGIKPYQKNRCRYSKFNMHTDRSEKESIKNANRSLKKGVRQQNKEEIRKEKENIKIIAGMVIPNDDHIFYEESWN